MKPGAGKQKGNSFERQVCRDLSLWMTGGEKRDLFWRSAMSGGRATVAFLRDGERLRVSGDICAVTREGHPLVDKYHIETKFLKDINFDGILTNNGKLLSVWKQTGEEAGRYDKDPMLIIKQNRLPTILCLPFAVRPAIRVAVPYHQLFIHDYQDFLRTPSKGFFK